MTCRTSISLWPIETSLVSCQVTVPHGTLIWPSAKEAATMPRPSTDTRERLLAAAVDYAAEHGLADLSLRTLAAALGTSHRILIFHFGSKEGLLVEVVRAVEAQQRALLDELRANPRLDPLGQMQALWQQLTSPALGPYER